MKEADRKSVRLEILRAADAESEQWLQNIDYPVSDDGENVASALKRINSGCFTDTEGRSVEPVGFECSCLQKKCGACAMVINGTPRLACDARLSEFLKSGTVRIEPLKKFPLVRDLIVDRAAVFERLSELRIWLEGQGRADSRIKDDVYDASRCLQCGCCLEVCPNFSTAMSFGGMSTAMAMSRIIPMVSGEQRKELYSTYRKAVFEGCGKSLACRSICPAGIDIERQLVRSNAAAVWKRRLRSAKKK